MSHHTPRNVEFQALYRHLCQAPQVRTGLPDHLHLFLNGVVYLVRTGIPWRDLPARFGPWNSVFRRGCQNSKVRCTTSAVLVQHLHGLSIQHWFHIDRRKFV